MSSGPGIQQLQQKQRRSSLMPAMSVSTKAQRDAIDFKERNAETVWQDSGLIKNCRRCGVRFTVTVRKHHCRECGNVFCNTCSNYKLVCEGKMKRACFDCYRKVVETDEPAVGLKHAYNPSQVINVKKDASVKQPVELPPAVAAPAPVVEATPVAGDKMAAAANGAATAPTQPLDPAENLPPWVEAVVYVSKVADSPTTQSVYPLNMITPAMLLDVGALSIPDSPTTPASILGSTAGSKSSVSANVNGKETEELNYMFRIRDKSIPKVTIGDEAEYDTNNATTVYYNCFVSYRKKFDKETNAFARSALVLVSRWPYPQLAFRLLGKLDEAFFWQVGATTTGTADTPADSSAAEGEEGGGSGGTAIQSLLMVAFGQLALWPNPKADTYMSLPFLGEMLCYSIPSDIYSPGRCNLSLGSACDSINIVSMLSPLGLLQHVWTLWELVITGKNVVIVGTCPAQCSELVIAVASLMSPTCFQGELRPYITAQDSDVAMLGKLAQVTSNKAKNGKGDVKFPPRPGSVVGITDAALLNTFEHFDAALLLEPVSTTGMAKDMNSKGLHSKFAANVKVLSKSTCQSLIVGYDEWYSSGQVKACLVCKVNPQSVSDRPMIIKIRTMKPRDRYILGDKLLRDNLKQLTIGYHKASASSTTSEKAQAEQQALMQHQRQVQQHQRAVSAAAAAAAPVSTSTTVEATATTTPLTVEDVVSLVKTIPDWAPNNVPSLIQLSVLVLIYCMLIPFLSWVVMIALPLVMVAGGMINPSLYKAHPMFEELLAKVLPDTVLKPQKPPSVEAGSTGSGQANQAAASAAAAAQRVNYSGVWKRTTTDNFDEFLAAQGHGPLQRRLSVSMSMVHTLTLDDALTSVRIQEKGGPVEIDCTYAIQGPAQNTTSLDKQFEETVTWRGSTLVCTKVHLPDRDYELILSRSFVSPPDNKDKPNTNMKCDCECRSLVNESSAKATAYFTLLGSSPQPLPATTTFCPPQVAVAASGAKKGASKKKESKKAMSKVSRVDFTGVWTRSRTLNFEGFVGAQGAGYMQRKLAASMPVSHTIIMDEDLTAIRLIEQGGPLNEDNCFTTGADFKEVKVLKKVFNQRFYWEDNCLVNHRVHELNDFEITLKRSFENGQILTVSIHKDLSTGVETVASSWFTKQKAPAADLVPPVADCVGDGANQEDDESDGEEGGEEVDVSSKKEKPQKKKESKKDAAKRLAKSSRVNFTGVWTRTKAVNFEGFVGAQGAGYMQRKLAASMAVTHTIIMDEDMSALRLLEQAGPMEQDNCITIGSDYRPLAVLKKKFKQRFYWEGSVLICQRVHELNDFELIIKRCFENDQIMATMIHRDLSTGQETESSSWFTKTKMPSADLAGPVVEPLDDQDNDEESSDEESEGDAAEEGDEVDGEETETASDLPTRTISLAGKSMVARPDMSGVWKRTNTTNFDNFVGAQGAGFVQRKLAASMALVHTITMNPPHMSGLQLQEKGGPLDVCNLYHIGAAPKGVKLLKKMYMDSVMWEGDALVLKKVHEHGDHEMIMKRYLEDDNQVIRLVSIHHNLNTGEEVEGISFFSKTGPSPVNADEIFPTPNIAEDVPVEKPVAKVENPVPAEIPEVKKPEINADAPVVEKASDEGKNQEVLSTKSKEVVNDVKVPPSSPSKAKSAVHVPAVVTVSGGDLVDAAVGGTSDSRTKSVSFSDEKGKDMDDKINALKEEVKATAAEDTA